MFLFDRKPSVFKKHRALFIWGIIILLVILIVLIVVFAILPFILVGGYVSFTIVESPGFCGGICHNMKPYVESYYNSSHDGILCAECHNEPGFMGFFKGTIVGAVKENILYISGNYGKEPIVCDLSGRSCLREECHKIERLNEKEFIYEGITFSHSIHNREMPKNIKLKCTSCHASDSLVHMKLDIKTCYLCHTNDIISKDEPDRCLVCHSEKIEKIKDFDHSKILKDKTPCSNCHKPAHKRKEVDQVRCDLCHHSDTKEMKEYTMNELHKVHTFDHTVDCDMCHTEVIHSYKAAFSENCLDCHKEIKTLKTTKYHGRSFPHLLHTSKYVAKCENCHSKKKETHGKLLIGDASCRKCHHTQKKIKCSKCHSIPNKIQNALSIAGLKGVEGYKTNTIDCKACHKKLTESSSLEKIKSECVSCHEEGYEEFVGEWQASTLKMISEIEKKIKGAKPGKNKKAKDLLDGSKKLLYYVKADGSKGIHNPDYVDEILKIAKKKINEALKLIEANE